jgi:hypothetical protein
MSALNNSLHNMFYSSGSFNNDKIITPEAFYVINMKDKIIDIPIFCKFKIDYIINHFNNYDRLIIPVHTEQLNWEPSTSLEALRSIDYPSSCFSRMDFKDSVYYVRNGIILDCNFKPLFLCTIKTDIEKPLRESIPCIYINPRVFCEKTTLNKYIVSTVVPWLLKNDVCIPVHSGDNPVALYSTTERYYKEPKVLIENIDCIETVRWVKNSVNLQKDLEEVLLKNLCYVIVNPEDEIKF